MLANLPDRESLSEALRTYRDAGIAFRLHWEEWRTREGTKAEDLEPGHVSDARKAFFRAGNSLWETYLTPIDTGIRVGNQICVDAAIMVLGIDIHAFRTGYLKGMWLRKIKRLALTEDQQNRLRHIVMTRLESKVAGREMVEWNRLLIRIARDTDLDRLADLRKHPC